MILRNLFYTLLFLDFRSLLTVVDWLQRDPKYLSQTFTQLQSANNGASDVPPLVENLHQLLILESQWDLSQLSNTGSKKLYMHLF